MTKYYTEHRPNLKRQGLPTFTPLSDLGLFAGFRGVYAFKEADVESIREQGHMRGLDDVSVYSEQLLLDFDNNPEAAEDFKTYLLNKNISFTEYDSGNRSVHFHVEIEAMEGKDVPVIQKFWINQHAPAADTSFYHKCGIYRLPGTYHLKNPGHCKRALSEHNGQLLRVEVPKAIVKRIVMQSKGEGTYGAVQWLIKQSISEGDRIPHMFKIIKAAQDVGYSFEDTLEELLYWNENYCYPLHDMEYVEKWAKRTWK